jgi:hypothetical protein
MNLPAQFSLIHSELNDFLFAPLGEEESGAPLSVLSALTRLNLDPWVEAARLSALPKEALMSALVALIALFPRERRTSSDVDEIAGRLAALLPARPSRLSPVNRPSGGPAGLRMPAMWQIWLALSIAVVAVVCAMLLRQ